MFNHISLDIRYHAAANACMHGLFLFPAIRVFRLFWSPQRAQQLNGAPTPPARKVHGDMLESQVFSRL